MKPVLSLGAWRHLNGAEGGRVLGLPAEHLVTHGVVVGMTGSGKTGLVTVLVEEAARVKVWGAGARGLCWGHAGAGVDAGQLGGGGVAHVVVAGAAVGALG